MSNVLSKLLFLEDVTVCSRYQKKIIYPNYLSSNRNREHTDYDLEPIIHTSQSLLEL